MQTPTETLLSEPDPRIPMAAERTFLAWLRTGLALMGFGFVVARFGLFLREVASGHNQALCAEHDYSLWIGIGLVVFGVAVNLIAAANHARYLKALAKHRTPPHLNTQLGNLVAIVLAVIGVGTVVYLLTFR